MARSPFIENERDPKTRMLKFRNQRELYQAANLEYGDPRLKAETKFAWFPVELNAGISDGDFIWLQSYRYISYWNFYGGD